MIFDRNFSIRTKDKVAKLVGGTSASLSITPFKNFQAPKKQVAWQAENHSFWAKKSFSNSGEKILFWHGLVEISPRNLRALALIVFILFFNVGY